MSHALSVRRNSKNSLGVQPEHVTPTGQRDTPQQRTPLPVYKTGAVICKGHQLHFWDRVWPQSTGGEQLQNLHFFGFYI